MLKSANNLVTVYKNIKNMKNTHKNDRDLSWAEIIKFKVKKWYTKKVWVKSLSLKQVAKALNQDLSIMYC